MRSSDYRFRIIYIPLCLYFNEDEPYPDDFFTFIYIPLCLYFNSSTDWRKHGRNAFTFHYVSILMKNMGVLSSELSSIYIPLCLYFNEIHPDIYIIMDIDIYIPLCLYFNLKSWVAKRKRDEIFTFHYVSILIFGFL